MTDFAVDRADDPRLDDYARLTDPPFRIADERARGYCIVESPQPLRVALGAITPERVRSVLVTTDQRSQLGDVLDHCVAPVYVASRSVLREIVGFDLHRGALASVARQAPASVAETVQSARTIVIAEGLNDYENLGALFRNAAALGADAVLLDPTCADPLYRRSIRVSIGHVFTVPWTFATAWPDALDEISERGFHLVALSPHGSDDALAALASGRPARVALLIGAEGPGLSAAALTAADESVRIPMRSGVDSLNVATAAAIALHQIVPTNTTYDRFPTGPGGATG